MLPASEEEKRCVINYMKSQAPDLKVVFLQKVYTENVLSHEHCVWDVHTDVDRWWIITNPTNLYSQEQFPNMDLALTFHIGLCLRIPRTDKQKFSGAMWEPLQKCLELVRQADAALHQANNVSAYQAGGGWLP